MFRKQSVAESLVSLTSHRSSTSASSTDFHSVGMWLLDSQMMEDDGSEASIITLEDPATLDEDMVVVDTEEVNSWLMQ